MKVVFAGPTIRHEEVERHLDCICLPPVSHGDILKVLSDKPTVIGIIDGYFEGVPSVWHKEILYALEQGVRVYGCSSMGALRAAELHPFGMRGVGQIFEWYRDGDILDDDEVAVLHGPAEVGYVVASEPMVNIRATLALACEQKVINSTQQSKLLEIAKKTFYKKRSWAMLFKVSDQLQTDVCLNSSAKDWLIQNRIDLKQRDALAMLNLMREAPAESSGGTGIPFHFEWTHVWDVAFHENTRSRASSDSLAGKDGRVLDQLRLDPDQYRRVEDKALLRWLGSADAASINHNDLKTALKRFRASNQLRTRAQLDNYMSQTGLNEKKLTSLLESVSRLDQQRQSVGDLETGMVDQLKLDGVYLDLLNIADRKKASLNLTGDCVEQIDVLPLHAIAWYFVEKLGTTIPARLEDHLAEIGLDNSEDFYRLVTVDYLFCQETDNGIR